MFTDFNSEVTGFDSIPETERLVNDSSCQTVDIQISNQASQTATAVSIASQASPSDFVNNADPPYDADKLLKFLNRILPQLEEELKYCDSNNDLNFNQNINEFGRNSNERNEHSGRQTMLKPDFCKEKVVSGLSWNSSNVMLAIACSESSHKGWCTHESIIELYNTAKPQFEKFSASQVLKVNGCVRYIDFHSHIPSLLAGGLYSGEVIIWDLKHDEEILMVNKKGSGDETAHVDVITYLSWRDDESGSWLVTAGRDGRIIFWKVTISSLTYEVNKRFLILRQHLTTTAALNEHLEVLHLDFQSSEGPYFVAACGGGTTFYCSATTARPLTSSFQYKDPILLSYKPRTGIITQVSCNPDMFASCGTDSEIHIYKYDQESPILKIYTNYALLGVKWNSPKEIVSWGEKTVECHKIDSGARTLIFEDENGISRVSFKLSSLWNIRKFAIGNKRGEILILQDWISS